MKPHKYSDQVMDAAFKDPGFLKIVGESSIIVWNMVHKDKIQIQDVAGKLGITVFQAKYKLETVSRFLGSCSWAYERGVEAFCGAGNARSLIRNFFVPPTTPRAVETLNDLKEFIESQSIHPGMVLVPDDKKPLKLSNSKFLSLCEAVGIDGNYYVKLLKQKSKEKIIDRQNEKLQMQINAAIQLLEKYGYAVEKKQSEIMHSA